MKILMPISDRSYLLKKESSYDITISPIKEWTKSLIEENDYVFPQTESQFEAIYIKFGDLSKFMMVQEEIYHLCADKVRFNQYLIDNGFSDIIPEMHIKDTPMIVKPNIGVGSKGVRLYRNNEEPLIEVGDFTQRYEMGEFEYSSTVIFDGKNIRFLKTFFHSIDKFPYGIKDELSQGIIPRSKFIEEGVIFEDTTPDLGVEYIKDLCSLLGYVGVLNVQFTIKDGKFFLFEINTRINGLGRKFIKEICDILIKMKEEK